MTKPDKLYALILTSTAETIRFTDFERLLRAFGFAHHRTKGSHRSYKHPSVPEILTIQPRGNNAVDYQVRRLLELVRQYDLHMEE